jgi:hypothetical protein
MSSYVPAQARYIYNLQSYVDVVKRDHDILMSWSKDVLHDSIIVVMSKNRVNIKQVISRCDLEDGLYIQILENMIDRLDKTTPVEDVIMPVDASSFRDVVAEGLEKLKEDAAAQILSNNYGVYKVPNQTIRGAIGAPIWVDDTATTVSVGSGGGGGWPLSMSYPDSNKIIGDLHKWAQENGDTLKQFTQDDLKKIAYLKEAGVSVMDNMYRSIMAPNQITLDNNPNVVFAGGAFTSLYHDEMVKDYDVFILNDPDTRRIFFDSIETAKKINPDRFQESDLNYLNNGSTKNIHRITLDKSTKVQYIVTTYKTRKELLDSFDAEHACVSYQAGKLYISPLTFDCIKRKIIKAHKGNTIAVWRVDKFTKKGFKFEIDLV